MSGWKPCLLAVALGAWLGTPAPAQEAVPSGWAAEFGYQSLDAPAFVGGDYPGPGFPVIGSTLRGQGGSGSYVEREWTTSDFVAPSSQVVNVIHPLIDSIRRSTRRKGGW